MQQQSAFETTLQAASYEHRLLPLGTAITASTSIHVGRLSPSHTRQLSYSGDFAMLLHHFAG